MNDISHRFDESASRALDALDQLDPTSEEYRRTVDSINVLAGAKEQSDRSSKTWKDRLFPILGSVIPIVVICAFEKSDVITSKGLGFAPKPKL